MPKFIIQERPGDRRGFIHKKILRGISAVTSFLPVPGAGAISRVTGILSGSRRGARPSRMSETEKNQGRAVKFPPIRTQAPPSTGGGGSGRCFPPWRPDPRTGECRIFAGEQSGVDATPVGEAVMGQYGAALAPGNMVIDRAVCLRGMQLGNDGLCYNKGQISNKQRMWPAGRRPLLTGGDMRAISIAARAGKRLERTTKRLQGIGLMKKPHRHAAPRRISVRESGPGDVIVK